MYHDEGTGKAKKRSPQRSSVRPCLLGVSILRWLGRTKRNFHLRNNDRHHRTRKSAKKTVRSRSRDSPPRRKSTWDRNGRRVGNRSAGPKNAGASRKRGGRSHGRGKQPVEEPSLFTRRGRSAARGRRYRRNRAKLQECRVYGSQRRAADEHGADSPPEPRNKGEREAGPLFPSASRLCGVPSPNGLRMITLRLCPAAYIRYRWPPPTSPGSQPRLAPPVSHA